MVRNLGVPTAAEQALLDAIAEFERVHGRAPYRPELAPILGIKEGTVESRIKMMRDKGISVPSAPGGRPPKLGSSD